MKTLSFVPMISAYAAGMLFVRVCHFCRVCEGTGLQFVNKLKPTICVRSEDPEGSFWTLRLMVLQMYSDTEFISLRDSKWSPLTDNSQVDKDGLGRVGGGLALVLAPVLHLHIPDPQIPVLKQSSDQRIRPTAACPLSPDLRLIIRINKSRYSD